VYSPKASFPSILKWSSSQRESDEYNTDGPANLNLDAKYVWNVCTPVNSIMFGSLIPLLRNYST